MFGVGGAATVGKATSAARVAVASSSRAAARRAAARASGDGLSFAVPVSARLMGDMTVVRR